MYDEQVIKEKYGEDYTYEKWYSTEIDLTTLPKNKSVVYGDGETYCWMLTKKEKESVPAETRVSQPEPNLLEAIKTHREKLPSNWFWEKCYELAHGFNGQLVKYWSLKNADKKSSVASYQLLLHDRHLHKDDIENDEVLQFLEKSLEYIDFLIAEIERRRTG